MAENNITPEAWGGDIPFINISAVTYILTRNNATFILTPLYST